MNKRLLFPLVSFIILLGIGLILFGNLLPTSVENYTNSSPSVSQETDGETKENIEKYTFPVTISDTTHRVAFVKVENPENLTLIPNFKERRPTSEVVAQQKCQAAVNGGFYTPAYTPLGLFVVRGVVLSEKTQSSVANGFFWVSSAGRAFIEESTPDSFSAFPFIFQAGPVVKINDREFTKLATVNDEASRRSLVAIDKKGDVYFIAVFDGEHALSGPLLSTLPDVVRAIEREKHLSFTDVLNLDGGSASFFYTKSLTLNELALVGSLLCEKE